MKNMQNQVFWQYDQNNESMKLKIYISIYTHILCFRNENHENWSNSCGDIIKKVVKMDF